MIDKTKIIKILEKYLSGTDKFIVDIKLSPDNKIVVFIDGDNPISVKDCMDVNRFLEGELDRDKEDFELQVSSAGIDHAFVLNRQYENAIAKEVIVIDKEGQKYQGILNEVHEDLFTLKTIIKGKKKEQKEIFLNFSYNEIKETKRTIKFK